MKVYIVESSDYNEYERYGIYSTVEVARKKLQKLFDIVSKRCESTSNDNYPEKAIWKGKNKFIIKKRGYSKIFSIIEIYSINIVKVEDKL